MREEQRITLPDVTEAELAHILAGLRLWQCEPGDLSARPTIEQSHIIAEGFEPANQDDLIERLNAECLPAQSEGGKTQ